MNILISSNDNYIFPAAVMLKSLLLNNSQENIDIYFLYSDVKKYNLNYLKKVVSKYGTVSKTHFHLSPVEKSLFENFPVSHHFSIEAYYRLLVTEIIPVSEDRALWLDADMIVKRNLSELYNQDFNNKFLVVCNSINKDPGEQLNRLGCPEGTIYFNSGMILFNLKKIRENNITLSNYCSYFENNKDRILWLDQDILNGMYSLKTKVLDYKIYNYQMFSESDFSAEELSDINSNTVILHYIGAVKPWHKKYKNYCKKYWRDYAKSLYKEECIRRIVRKLDTLIKG